MMKAVQAVALLVIATMSANVINVALNSGMHHGVGLDTFLAGIADPWQLFINLDLVTGLLLMVAWIIYRGSGGPVLHTIAWVWMVMWWGNLVVAIYVLRAARQSDGDWSNFFMGRNAPGTNRVSVQGPRALALRLLYLVIAISAAGCLVTGLANVGFSGLPALGYVAGFTPLVLAFALLAIDRPASLQAERIAS